MRIAAHRLLSQIEMAAEHYADAEMHLTTALDLVGACDAPFERALTLLALVELRRASGADAGTAGILDEVRAICASLGAVPTLARAESLLTEIAAGLHGTAET